MRIKLLIVRLVEDLRLNAQFFQKFFGDRAVLRWTLNGLSSTIAQQQAPGNAEFISPRMPAEIVVVIQDQNARTFPCMLAEKVSGSQPTDASSNHNQVIFFLGVYWNPRALPEIPITQRVSDIVGSCR